MSKYVLQKLYVISATLMLCYNIMLSHDFVQANTQDLSTIDNETQSITKSTKAKKLDYANLFTKPDIDWNDIANEKSGLFVGLGVVGSLLNVSNTLPNNSLFNASYPLGAGFHTKFGYTHCSTPYIGFRMYGEYSRVFSVDSYTANIEYRATNTKSRQYTLDFYNVGINVIFDTNLSRNYIHTLSVIIDLSYLAGIDFASHWTQQTAGIESFGVDRFLSGNRFALGFGVGYVYNSKHRFELIFRRFTDIRESQESFIGSNDALIVFEQILTISMGYVYVF